VSSNLNNSMINNTSAAGVLEF